MNIWIGLIFILILIAMTYHGFRQGPAIFLAVLSAVAVGIVITQIGMTIFPTLFLSFAVDVTGFLGLNITKAQVANAAKGMTLTNGINVAKTMFTSLLALLAAVPSVMFVNKRTFLIRKASAAAYNAVRIIGALLMFAFTLVLLWLVDAFLSFGASYSALLWQANDTLSKDIIISLICVQNPVRNAVHNLIFSI